MRYQEICSKLHITSKEYKLKKHKMLELQNTKKTLEKSTKT